MLMYFHPLFHLLIKKNQEFSNANRYAGNTNVLYKLGGSPKISYAIGAASLLYVTLFIINYLYHVFIFVAE